ncbi:carbon-nitrogen hydrolase family protein [Acidisoma cellulosilytica]|uniref:Carbon-nitrogen hydrolase family protein n=1 Tax=Acidisoma cellulosilyticum TaxID=2802395 RepID=A0A964E6B8_9PROT|nr:carbon-nitrogen hydrolase family protein [Acidisoma cellulosilyticum]MCB8883424.1 carbon-nitrogen hydrolase family protein [Acidisoma cellulosilyticum]
MNNLHIGIAQLRPAWGDKPRTVEIITTAIAEAASRDIDLLAFSETFLSGYPFWVCRTNGAAFDDARQGRAYAQFIEAAVEIDGPELAQVAEAAKDHGVSVYLGVNERGARAGRGTVWCTLATIDAEHGIIGAHRKLMPTHDERLVWGIGDAEGLRCHDFGGFRVGGLNCWENWMAHARSALYEDGEDVHISVWPGNEAVTKGLPIFAAQEGRMWCASVCGLLSLSDVPQDFEFYPDLKAEGLDVIFAGGSGIYDPTQTCVARIEPGMEGIASASIDRASLYAARQGFDQSGHYARPDIFDLSIQRRRAGRHG